MTAANAARQPRFPEARRARRRRAEPTLEDILAGPIVRALMLADRVDAEALAALLRSAALRLRKPARAGGSAAKTLRLRERRLALMDDLTRRRSQRWMTEEAAAAERHPNLLEDNPSSG